MKKLNNYITEKLRISSKNKYNYHPKTIEELRDILWMRLKDDKNADLNDIDVSQMTSLRKAFSNLNPHDIDISKWDVSNVTNMEYMFYNCQNFNCDLSDWDVSKVENMRMMFYDCCENFTGEGLENWDVSKVTDMRFMFDYCTSLKNIPSWYKG